MGIISFVMENIGIIMQVILGIIGVCGVVFLYKLFPRTSPAYSYYETRSRTVGKRNASITLSPNYNGTSYSGSIDWGDPGDTFYKNYHCYKLPSGKVLSYYSGESDEYLTESTQLHDGEYVYLKYNIFSHSCYSSEGAEKAFRDKEKRFEKKTDSILKFVAYFYNLAMILMLFSCVSPSDALVPYIYTIITIVEVNVCVFFIPLLLAFMRGFYISVTGNIVITALYFLAYFCIYQYGVTDLFGDDADFIGHTAFLIVAAVEQLIAAIIGIGLSSESSK